MNDNYWYPRDPQRFLTDTAWCDAATYMAHGRLTDTFYALGRPLVDDPGEIQRMAGIMPQDYNRVRGNLERLGWKFENGLCRHKRIESTMVEMEENRLSQLRRTAAATEARKNVTKNVTTTVTTDVTLSQPQPQPQPHIQPDPEPCNTHIQGRPPTLDEVKYHGQLIGMSIPEAERFWHHFESSGWIDRNRNPIINWKSKMATWKIEQQSRPLERAHKSAESHQLSPNITALSDSKEYERVIARIKQLSEGAASDAIGQKFYTQSEKVELKTLKARREILKKELKITL